ncbi:hypothetical protein D3C76_1249390 [compost metagenome]
MYLYLSPLANSINIVITIKTAAVPKSGCINISSTGRINNKADNTNLIVLFLLLLSLNRLRTFDNDNIYAIFMISDG